MDVETSSLENHRKETVIQLCTEVRAEVRILTSYSMEPGVRGNRNRCPCGQNEKSTSTREILSVPGLSLNTGVV